MPKFSGLVGLNHLNLMRHVSSSDLVRVSIGTPLLDIEPRASSSIMANCHELTLLTLPAFVEVMSVVAAKIVLLWSIIAPTGSADNLARPGNGLCLEWVDLHPHPLPPADPPVTR